MLGTLAAAPGPVVVSAVEHPAVMGAALASGQEVRVASVDSSGRVDLDALGRLLDRQVALVSVQLANHETGAVQPLAAIGRLVRRLAPHAVFHTDAVQAAAWIDLADAAAARRSRSASAATSSAARRGPGCWRAGAAPALRAILHGGGQERELRSGTHNVAGIVGLGVAVAAARTERGAAAERVAGPAGRPGPPAAAGDPGPVETARSGPRTPGHLHLRVPGVESEALLVLLDEAGVCASAGAACASGAMEPSPVLLAMGVPKDEALSSLRLTLGPDDYRSRGRLWPLRSVPDAVARLRGA